MSQTEPTTPLTGAERDAILDMRDPEMLLHDARQMGALLRQMTRAGDEELVETRAIGWLINRLTDTLDMLEEHIEKGANQ